MKTRYRILFEVAIRHTFYTSGRSEDFRIEPTPYCARLFRSCGLLFREQDYGFAVYAEVEPESDPAVLLRPLGSGTLKLSFLLRLVNPYFLNISDLPAHDPAGSLFYFNNLRKDIDGNTRYLGDSVNDARVGAAVEVEAGRTYTYPFKTAVNSAVLELRDLFDTLKETVEFSYKETETVDSFRLNLGEIDHFPPGRYVLTDDQGGERAFYYDPGLFGKNVFGLIEIFHSDKVHEDYRFLNTDGMLAPEKGRYTLQFEARETTWRYIVIKQYDTNGINLADLTISGSVAFKPPVSDTDRVTFTSNDEVPLAESDRDLKLLHNSTELLDLPSPDVHTSLQEGASEDSYTSERCVYV